MIPGKQADGRGVWYSCRRLTSRTLDDHEISSHLSCRLICYLSFFRSSRRAVCPYADTNAANVAKNYLRKKKTPSHTSVSQHHVYFLSKINYRFHNAHISQRNRERSRIKIWSNDNAFLIQLYAFGVIT